MRRHPGGYSAGSPYRYANIFYRLDKTNPYCRKDCAEIWSKSASPVNLGGAVRCSNTAAGPDSGPACPLCSWSLSPHRTYLAVNATNFAYKASAAGCSFLHCSQGTPEASAENLLHPNPEFLWCPLDLP